MKELSKTTISIIRSLYHKKYRQKHQLFIAEGQKIIDEIATSTFKIKYIIYNKDKKYNIVKGVEETYITNNAVMSKISSLKTPPAIIAVVEQKNNFVNISELENKLSIVVDDIQNPGNLGTLIRICDWFGIDNILCSNNSVDVYNPKVIQASMGSILRVNIFYIKILDFISEYKSKTNNLCMGTFIKGENIYRCNLPKKGLLILGNEGNGISKSVEGVVDKKLHIPSFAKERECSESLNISVAAAILISEFKRNET